MRERERDKKWEYIYIYIESDHNNMGKKTFFSRAKR
jgi:hypothetical protein